MRFPAKSFARKDLDVWTGRCGYDLCNPLVIGAKVVAYLRLMVRRDVRFFYQAGELVVEVCSYWQTPAWLFKNYLQRR